MDETFAATHPDDPHRLGRSHWLRAAVLGATDGIVSISSLLIGVAAAVATADVVLATGVAGLVAGAMSIAASEYISVSSQADIERAEIAREQRALKDDPEGELAEMAAIYRERGLSRETAEQVARELTHSGALEAHLRDEVGCSTCIPRAPGGQRLRLGRPSPAPDCCPLPLLFLRLRGSSYRPFLVQRCSHSWLSARLEPGQVVRPWRLPCFEQPSGVRWPWQPPTWLDRSSAGSSANRFFADIHPCAADTLHVTRPLN